MYSANGRIQIEYIEARSSNKGKDAHAKLAREQKEEAKSRIQKWEEDEWDKEIEDPLFHGWKRDESMWQELRGHSRSTAKRLIERLTGHGNFRDMLRKKNQSLHRSCRVCAVEGMEESNHHIWFDCRETEEIRKKFIIKNQSSWINMAKELLKHEKIATLLQEFDR